MPSADWTHSAARPTTVHLDDEGGSCGIRAASSGPELNYLLSLLVFYYMPACCIPVRCMSLQQPILDLATLPS